MALSVYPPQCMVRRPSIAVHTRANEGPSMRDQGVRHRIAMESACSSSACVLACEPARTVICSFQVFAMV